jgi:replicative DNA helicase
MQEIQAQIYREAPVDLVVIDGIELINGGKSDRTHELRGEVARWGLSLAIDPDIMAPVIIPAQIATKQVKQRFDKRPLPGDFYASSEPEFATDVTLTLHRQDMWIVDKKETPPNHELEVTLWKHRLKRKAVPGMVKLRFGDYGDITDLSEQPEPIGF